MRGSLSEVVRFLPLRGVGPGTRTGLRKGGHVSALSGLKKDPSHNFFCHKNTPISMKTLAFPVQKYPVFSKNTDIFHVRKYIKIPNKE